MITALQAAKIKMASKLFEARELVVGCRSSIIYIDGRANLLKIEKVVGELDDLLCAIVSNEHVDEPEQEF